MTDLVILKKDDLADLLRQASEQAAIKVIGSLMDKISPMRPKHVSQRQAAEMLDISTATVSRMVKAGSIRLNKCGLISIEQIDEMIK